MSSYVIIKIMKSWLLIYCFSLLFLKDSMCQNCNVTMDSLKGSYTGECKKGLAHGKGTAIGIDSYIGEFKSGYPNGEGKYTWKNGNTYEGSWVNGMFEGFGIYNYRNSLDSSKVVSGYWKKGTYIGIYEKPYLVSLITNNISDVNVRKLNNIVSEITIIVKSNSGGASNIENPVLPKSNLVRIQLLCGRFEDKLTDTSSRITSKYTLRKVTFPFCAVLSFETPGKKLPIEQAKVELYENGNWYIKFYLDD